MTAPASAGARVIVHGRIETEATQIQKANPEFYGSVARRTPAGGSGHPDDIGSTAVFLAADEAAFVNGTTLTVDGGLTACV